MIYYTKKSIFNMQTDAIVNTINCKGFMGKGIALEFSLRYPDLLIKYQQKCQKNEINIGKMFYYKTDNQIIVNFPTKDDFKLPSQYDWIKKGIKDFKNTYKFHNIASIAFPPLGCGNGELNFNIVKKIIEEELVMEPIDIYICLDTNSAEGKELEMIKNFNDTKIEDFIDIIEIPKAQSTLLVKYQNKIKRFYEIQNIEGIGTTTYKKLHNYFYNYKIKLKQESLF